MFVTTEGLILLIAAVVVFASLFTGRGVGWKLVLLAIILAWLFVPKYMVTGFHWNR